MSLFKILFTLVFLFSNINCSDNEPTNSEFKFTLLERHFLTKTYYKNRPTPKDEFKDFNAIGKPIIASMDIPALVAYSLIEHCSDKYTNHESKFIDCLELGIHRFKSIDNYFKDRRQVNKMFADCHNKSKNKQSDFNECLTKQANDIFTKGLNRK